MYLVFSKDQRKNCITHFLVSIGKRLKHFLGNIRECLAMNTSNLSLRKKILQDFKEFMRESLGFSENYNKAIIPSFLIAKDGT